MTEGRKFDDAKPNIGFFLKSFPNAIRATTKQNDFGAKKYDPLNWKKVSLERYENALGRHYMEHLEDPNSIDESGETHLAAVIWNAMACYEQLLARKNGTSLEEEYTEEPEALTIPGWQNNDEDIPF